MSIDVQQFETQSGVSSSGGRSSGTAWWLLAVLFVTACISYADRLVLSVLVDPLRHSLGLSDSAVGVLQGPAFTLVYVFSTLFFGRLADRNNRRKVLIAAASAWCVATLLCGLANSFTTLLVARMLVGVSEAALVPAAVSMIADSFEPERRGVAVGVLGMGTAIGGPLGITLGGALLTAVEGGSFGPALGIELLEPWRAVLVLMGALGLASPLLLLTVREPKRLHSSQDQDWRAAARYFIAARYRLGAVYLAAGLLSIGDYGLVAWVPTAIQRRFAWPPDEVGAYFGAITICAGIAGSLCGGYLSDAGSKRGGLQGRLAICIVGALIATGGALSIAGPSAVLTLVGLGVWVFASIIAGIGAIAVLQGAIPNQFRGTGMSLFTFCNTLLGLGAGPTLVALVTDHVYGDPNAVGLAIATVVAPAGVIAAMLYAYARGVIGSPPRVEAVREDSRVATKPNEVESTPFAQ